YIINCTAQEAERVLSVTNDGARNEFEESTACIGAATCQVGLRDSQGVLKDVIMYLREKNYPDYVLPRVFISGCPSSCGTNQIGQLGFQGTVKVIERKPYPAFTLSVSGNDRLLQERFGDIKGVILEDDMCLFLSAIADAVTAAHTDFATWLAKEKEQLDAILHTYLK
ncbi:MAG: nitrite/sulfite reductase, partial [Clostridium sp.]